MTARSLDILLCSTPVHGHVTPLLAVSRALVERGHRVHFLTGERYLDRAAATGAHTLRLPAEADYDDTDMDAAFPGRVGLTGPAGIRYDMTEIFLRPARAQLVAVDAVVQQLGIDAVLAESLFLGAALLAGRPRSERPALLNLGIVPLGLKSRDTAPFGLGVPPRPGRLGRLRNAALTAVAEKVVFAPVQRAALRVGLEAGTGLPGFVLDWPSHADGVIQFTVPEFEYPRTDLRVPVHFVGPVSRTQASDTALPAWCPTSTTAGRSCTSRRGPSRTATSATSYCRPSEPSPTRTSGWWRAPAGDRSPSSGQISRQTHASPLTCRTTGCSPARRCTSRTAATAASTTPWSTGCRSSPPARPRTRPRCWPVWRGRASA